ncbi:RbsD/FucU domain-containing protein [Gryllotalpicola reticulitermitis]|uniref:RbsD/FucU domain-containing protein n=1 Tax=Gryllotalpicola reticulitermitis TaxID=1184153 RepID=A0ABV8Q9G2_9MICO
MLLGIDPLLSGELLLALDHMGHGDALVIADANFPAQRLGPRRVISLRGIDAPSAAHSIFTVFPIDPAEPIGIMHAPSGRLAVQQQLLDECPAELAAGAELVDRHAFYELAANAALIVQTGDRRPYANLLVHKAGINR